MFIINHAAPPIDKETEVSIQLIHQQLHFSKENLTIAWGVYNKVYDEMITAASPFILELSDCNPQNTSEAFEINETSFILLFSELNINTFFNITSSDGITIEDRFRIMPGGKSKIIVIITIIYINSVLKI